jgi:hypothetical protein
MAAQSPGTEVTELVKASGSALRARGGAVKKSRFVREFPGPDSMITITNQVSQLGSFQVSNASLGQGCLNFHIRIFLHSRISHTNELVHRRKTTPMDARGSQTNARQINLAVRTLQFRENSRKIQSHTADSGSNARQPQGLRRAGMYKYLIYVAPRRISSGIGHRIWRSCARGPRIRVGGRCGTIRAAACG